MVLGEAGAAKALVALVNTSDGDSGAGQVRCALYEPEAAPATAGLRGQLPGGDRRVPGPRARLPVQPDAGGRGPRRAPLHSAAHLRCASDENDNARRSSRGRSTRCQCAENNRLGPVATVALEPDLGRNGESPTGYWRPRWAQAGGPRVHPSRTQRRGHRAAQLKLFRRCGSTCTPGDGKGLLSSP